MLLLPLGLMLVLIAALSISFPQLCHALKTDDTENWKRLGSPNGIAVADLGQSASVFSWVLNHGYESSTSDTVNRLGQQALQRALMAKYAMLAGVIMIVVGFFSALLGF